VGKDGPPRPRDCPPLPLPVHWKTTLLTSTTSSTPSLNAKLSAASSGGVAVPGQRNKTLTALAATEAVVGRCAAQRGTVPATMVSLRVYMEPGGAKRRRVKILLEDNKCAPKHRESPAHIGLIEQIAGGEDAACEAHLCQPGRRRRPAAWR
jgi:hypothetical protein